MINFEDYQLPPRQPLQGRTITLVRDAHRAKDTIAHLTLEGASVRCFAAISLTPNPTISISDLCKRLDSQAVPSILLLTSPTAVALFFASAPTLPPGAIIAVVGQRTAAMLESVGHSPQIIATDQRAQGLAQAVIHYLGDACSRAYCLHPTSDQSLPTLREKLAEAGVRCQEEILYYNKIVEYSTSELEFLWRNIPDALVFYSPTAVEAFLSYNLPVTTRQIPMIAIGPVTAHALTKNKIIPAAIASQPTDMALSLALNSYFRAR